MKIQTYEGVCSGFCSHFHEQTALPDKQTATLLLSRNKCKLIRSYITSCCALCSTDAEHFLTPDSTGLLSARRWKGEAANRSCLWVLSSGPYMGLIRGWAVAGAADTGDRPRLHTASSLQPQPSLVPLPPLISFITVWVCMWVSYWKCYGCILSRRLRWIKYSWGNFTEKFFAVGGVLKARNHPDGWEYFMFF